MLEGTAIHKALATTELKIPGDGKRVEVCGVPIRGQIDLIEGDTIVDYKTKSAFYITRYGVKGSGTKPWVDIWEPEEENSIGDFVDQLSIYGVILRKGLDIHTNYGKVHRIYRGVKPDKGAFRTFLFTLLTEEELENKIGPWLRSLAVGLTTATNNSNAWKDMPPDGRGFISSRGAMWMCDKCQLKEACFSKDSLDVF
jgi:CRISPR/Cas system-associated exonuclease Cas4 (RecB family)